MASFVPFCSRSTGSQQDFHWHSVFALFLAVAELLVRFSCQKPHPRPNNYMLYRLRREICAPCFLCSWCRESELAVLCLRCNRCRPGITSSYIISVKADWSKENQTSCQRILTKSRVAPTKNEKMALPMGGSGPHLIRGSLGQPESIWSYLKRHINRFIRFCRAHGCDQQTDRRTNHATPLRTGRIFADCVCKCNAA